LTKFINIFFFLENLLAGDENEGISPDNPIWKDTLNKTVDKI